MYPVVPPCRDDLRATPLCNRETTTTTTTTTTGLHPRRTPPPPARPQCKQTIEAKTTLGGRTFVTIPVVALPAQGVLTPHNCITSIVTHNTKP
eukprot:TRINITY_DN21369_c0_g2_i1.p1 TRINITY_DN21369_c0_g2~~TRINITY_DN21369_c0_g2_i1.p1  ORF type:complete len:100 (-),score=6.22 TRINITY_DN21369_c0_g2_i1:85-363(-)